MRDAVMLMHLRTPLADAVMFCAFKMVKDQMASHKKHIKQR